MSPFGKKIDKFIKASNYITGIKSERASLKCVKDISIYSDYLLYIYNKVNFTIELKFT